MMNLRKTGPAIGLIAALLVLGFSWAYAQTAAPKKVNINTASAADLETLPRIGPAIAQRIIDFRTANGPFKRVEDLLKVQGIGEKVYDQLKDLITVGEPAK